MTNTRAKLYSLHTTDTIRMRTWQKTWGKLSHDKTWDHKENKSCLALLPRERYTLTNNWDEINVFRGCAGNDGCWCNQRAEGCGCVQMPACGRSSAPYVPCCYGWDIFDPAVYLLLPAVVAAGGEWLSSARPVPRMPGWASQGEGLDALHAAPAGTPPCAARLGPSPSAEQPPCFHSPHPPFHPPLRSPSSAAECAQCDGRQTWRGARWAGSPEGLPPALPRSPCL